jgi:hypothetical protein
MENKPDNLIKETDKLWQRWSWLRWVLLLFGVSVVILSFYIIENPSFLPKFLSFIPQQFYGPLGGAVIGATLGNWKGRKELQLLLKFKEYYESTNKNT